MSMPETNKRKNLDALRVYAPSRGNLAIDSEALPYTRVAEPTHEVKPRRRPALVPAKKKPASRKRSIAQAAKENNVFYKLVAVACVLAVALALIVMLSGYNSISAAQRELNELSRRVAGMESMVEKTNVEYLFSIDAASSHEAANIAGMTYPVTGGAGN